MAPVRVDQALVPVVGVQHLERGQGNHKQSMAPGVSTGSLEGHGRGSKDLWERLVKSYQVQRSLCYLSAICRSPLLILSHLHHSLLTLRKPIPNLIYFRREIYSKKKS